MGFTSKVCAVVCTSAFLWGCSDDGASGNTEVVEQAWVMSIGDVELERNKESKIEGGTCRSGTVSGLTVEICTFKDAVSADSAREKGLAQVGSHTGVVLVRGSLLLVASDPNKVDVHGKKLNELSKIFLEPESGSPVKTLGL